MKKTILALGAVTILASASVMAMEEDDLAKRQAKMLVDSGYGGFGDCKYRALPDCIERERLITEKRNKPLVENEMLKSMMKEWNPPVPDLVSSYSTQLQQDIAQIIANFQAQVQQQMNNIQFVEYEAE